MAVFRGNLLLREIFLTLPSASSSPMFRIPSSPNAIRFLSRSICGGRIRCMASGSGDGGRKVSSRLSQVQQLLQEAEERSLSAGNEPIPKITLVLQEVADLAVRMSTKEKNRINKDGEIVISSTKTRTQKGNIEDALEKLQAIIDAASYVPPPPSEEQKKKIAKMAAIGEQKRLQSKKVLSQKKAFRRSKDSWD